MSSLDGKLPIAHSVSTALCTTASNGHLIRQACWMNGGMLDVGEKVLCQTKIERLFVALEETQC